MKKPTFVEEIARLTGLVADLVELVTRLADRVEALEKEAGRD